MVWNSPLYTIVLPERSEMKNDQSKKQLIKELAELRHRLDVLERTSILQEGQSAAPEKDRELYQTVVETTPESIVVIDTAGRICSWNPATEKLTGYTEREVKGKNILKVAKISSAEKRRIIKGIKGLDLGREEVSYELETPQKEGKKRWMSVKFSILALEKEPRDILIISRDITERKRLVEELRTHRNHLEKLVEYRTGELLMANEQLKKEVAERKKIEDQIKRLNEKLEQRVKARPSELETAYEELKKLHALKESFLSSVSHELRTPLTSIRSFSEILLRYENEAPETRKEFLEIIHIESERLTRLINDVLDLSRIEAGMMIYHDDLNSLEEIITAASKSQHQLLQQKALGFHLDIDPDLPLAFVDPDRIHQVITNLLANAIKFSNEGDEIRIEAKKFKGKRSREATDWIKVTVSDQGTGIQEKDFSIIFDKFRQANADSLKGKPKGTGLGLPICREIITHYRGNIWVESEHGQGSTFAFTIPSASSLSKSEEPAIAARAGENWKEKTILLVNHNKNIRKRFRRQLQKRGYTILEAATGPEVLTQAKKKEIDLITLDLVSPIVRSYNVLTSIRNNPVTRNIPVLIISMLEEKKDGIMLGDHDFLVKPFPENELLQKVRTLLGEEPPSFIATETTGNST